MIGRALVLALVALTAAPLAAQTGSYPSGEPIWMFYATGLGYPVDSPALKARAELEGISPECLKSFGVAVMTGALVAPDSPATYIHERNLVAGLAEIKVTGVTRTEAQQAYNVYSPYRNRDIDCVGRGNHSLAGSTWDTTYGEMYFTSDRTSLYDDGKSSISGRRTGLVLTGYWVDEAAARTCESSRNGSDYWGHIRIEFNADLTSFSAQWGYCEDEPSSSWTGTRDG